MQRIREWITEHKIITGLLAVPLVIIGAIYWHARGPFHGYRADLIAPDAATATAPGTLRVGVAIRDVTPNLFRYDTFVDKDGNNKYNPDKGDYFEDTNGNGKVDAVWVAGFGNNRPAQDVNDPLWARAIAFENNGVRVVLVSIDGIGIFHEKIIAMRKRLDPALGVDHLIVSSLHDHEAPDTMGIWSVGLEKPHFRFDYHYMDLVQTAVVEAATEAVEKLEPAEAILAQVEVGPEGFMDDSRIPLVYDNLLRCARFVRPATDETIATMVNWGNHPETLGGSNPALTSDFSHYWRKGVEEGVPDPNGVEGLGGICVYYQGMVGGLMTQLHTTVPHRNGQAEFRDASFEKAQALGENLAIETVKALRGKTAWRPTDTRVAVVAQSVFIKPKPLFRLALLTGLVHPGFYGSGKFRTEVDALRIGDIEILTTPGELYPEIALGGVEAPAGQDFDTGPVEVPPLCQVMRGRMKMVIGLANDEIGYIVPKSQWDVKPPYAYGRDKSQYGEENSFGPEVAPTLHAASMDVLRELETVLARIPVSPAP